MKRRLSASIDEDVLAAAERAVAAGRAPSLSALVEEALQHRVEEARRLDALAEVVAADEAELGVLTPTERRRIMAEWEADATYSEPAGGALGDAPQAPARDGSPKRAA